MNKLIVPLNKSSNPTYRNYIKSKVLQGYKVSDNPLTISCYKPEDIELIKFEHDHIVVTQPDFNTYGASMNKIYMKLFSPCTIPEKIYNELRACTDIDFIYKTFGDSIERLLWIKTLIDRGNP